MKWLSHLRTVQHHRFLVLRHCWRVGLYWQGLTHDLSKFSPVEFSAGAKYYQGNRSPNEIERREKGYSAAWLHHKGRNKHHLEYWIDYAADGSGMCGMKMPIQYVIEMFCDRVAASKTYRGAAYRDSDPYDYYAHSVDHYIIHPDTAAALESLLRILRDEGEEYVLRLAAAGNEVSCVRILDAVHGYFLYPSVLNLVRDTYKVMERFLDGCELVQEGDAAWVEIPGTD